MRRISTRLCWVGLFAWTVTACGGPNEPALTEAEPAAADGAAAKQDDSPPGPMTRVQALDVALLPDNSEQMFARLQPGDLQLVQGFYRNYGESVMVFNNKQELLWLIRHGYPLPEDVLEAAGQTEQELQARYEGGDVMAGYFLLDRKAAAIEGSPFDFTSHLKTATLAEELLVRGGPFSGYAYYRYNNELENAQDMALAGLLWANWQGDYRAAYDLMDLTGAARSNGEQLPESGAVAFAYQALLSGIRSTNPAVLTRKVDPLILYKNE